MSLSDDGFDDGFDDDLLSQIPLDATAYQTQRPALQPAARPPAVKKSTFSFGGSKPPPAKKPRLYSAPPVPPSSSQPPDFDIVVDKNGQYGIDVRHPSPQEDEIVDQRAALPPPTQKQPPRRLSTVPPQAQTSQLQQQLAKALADLAEVCSASIAAP